MEKSIPNRENRKSFLYLESRKWLDLEHGEKCNWEVNLFGGLGWLSYRMQLRSRNSEEPRRV